MVSGGGLEVNPSAPNKWKKRSLNMEQKSTGWTGTGTEVDEKKSKPSVIYESMNVIGRNGVSNVGSNPT